jgi:hypothetical protein
LAETLAGAASYARIVAVIKQILFSLFAIHQNAQPSIFFSASFNLNPLSL